MSDLRTTGPYAVIVAANRRAAENWARQDYHQTEPYAVMVGPARDGFNKTFHVYDQAVEVQS